MRNPAYVSTITSNITKLHKEYPGIQIGEHIANALGGSDIYNITDKDLAESLSSYLLEIELDGAFQCDDSPDEEYDE